MHCSNGVFASHECKLSTSKSTRIVESCLLGFLRDSLLTESRLLELVDKANHFLQEEARKPLPDLRPLKNQERRLASEIQRLFERMGKVRDEHLCDAYEAQIADRQRKLSKVRLELSEANRQHAPVPERLDRERVKQYVSDLRAVLNLEIPAAAEAIRMLTGAITISQVAIPGRGRGAKWIASFSPTLLQLLREIGRAQSYPDSITLEYLCDRKWIIPEKVELEIGHLPQYEQLAPDFREMHQRGLSLNAIAAAHGMSWPQAKEIMTFALTGERPKWKNHARPGTQKGKAPLYQQISAKVVELHDRELKPFDQIARDNHWGKSTVRRAYDFGRPEAAKEAAETGEKPYRGKYRKISAAKLKQAHEMLQQKAPFKEIAAATGISERTIRNEADNQAKTSVQASNFRKA